MSSSVHFNNKGKDILILDKGPAQGLDYFTLTAETQYSVNSTRPLKSCLSLYFNGSNSFLFFNATKICKFKAQDSEIKNYLLCFGNISGDFSANNMKKRTRLNRCVYNFSVDYRAFDASNIIDIHKYLTKKHEIK